MGKKLIKPLIILLSALILSIPFMVTAQSPADCDAYARRVEMDAGSTTGGVVGGGLKGRAFGAIVGDSSKAAKRGALLGALAGGARQSSHRSNVYKNAYDRCMAGQVNW